MLGSPGDASLPRNVRGDGNAALRFYLKLTRGGLAAQRQGIEVSPDSIALSGRHAR